MKIKLVQLILILSVVVAIILILANKLFFDERRSVSKSVTAASTKLKANAVSEKANARKVDDLRQLTHGTIKNKHRDDMRRFPEHVGKGEAKQPNVIFILADDYGYYDIGYHGSEIKTPVMDRLAAEGVKLDNYYVQPICTPTRTQLMTGRYQIHTGFQHSLIWPYMPSCLPLDEITVAQKLKEVGYSTHLIGKWHLGLYKKACWPTRRGFDTFFGLLLGSGDYYKHQRFDDFDFRDQEELAWGYQGQYATYAFAKRAQDIIAKKKKNEPFFMLFSNQAVHAPLQVPSQYLEQYNHIKDQSRKLYAGMTTCMDEAIGNITRALKEHDLYKNTVIIFSTDNGGDPKLGASNWPLRGAKRTLWEGGIRGIGFVHSPLLHPRVRGTTNRELIHVSDWFPTIVAGLAGGKLEGHKPLDGFNVWDTIRFGTQSPRDEILHNIDPFEGYDHPFSDALYNNFTFDPKMRSAIRVGDWKLLTGPVGEPRTWVPPAGLPGLRPEKPRDRKGQTVWLFNIRDDPYERHDKSAQRPDIVKVLMARLQEHYATSVPIIYPPDDLRAEPKLHNNTWTNWE